MKYQPTQAYVSKMKKPNLDKIQKNAYLNIALRYSTIVALAFFLSYLTVLPMISENFTRSVNAILLITIIYILLISKVLRICNDLIKTIAKSIFDINIRKIDKYYCFAWGIPSYLLLFISIKLLFLTSKALEKANFSWGEPGSISLFATAELLPYEIRYYFVFSMLALFILFTYLIFVFEKINFFKTIVISFVSALLIYIIISVVTYVMRILYYILLFILSG